MSLKDSARDNQLDCVINYFFQLHLMLYVCVRRFDVIVTVGSFLRTKRSLICAAPGFLHRVVSVERDMIPPLPRRVEEGTSSQN